MRRHELDPVSLVFGLLFLLIALAFLTDAPAVAVLRLRWLLPALGIVVGIGLLGSALRGPDEDGAPPPDAV